jgi:hypothetical protein
MTIFLLSLMTLGSLLLLGAGLTLTAANKPARKAVRVKIRDKGAPHDARKNRFN